MKNRRIPWVCFGLLVWAFAFYAGAALAESDSLSMSTLQQDKEHPEGDKKEHPEGDKKEHPEGDKHEHPEGDKHEHPEGDKKEDPDGDEDPPMANRVAE